MGSKGTNTTTQTATPDPAAMAAYQQLLGRASGVANTPYQAYTGNLTAGINQQQNLGIGNINAASQAGSPWFDYAASMAHPLAQSDIERYQNPYTQHVVDATQAQFDRSNAQQQEGLRSRAAAQGSLGGSRANIAAADMGYQQQLGQAPVIAGLYNQSYNQALTAAQQQQQAGFTGAGVGANIQQAGLQGAGAQIGAGTLQQQAEQAALTAQYGQYQQAQAFPYQQTQWLAGVDTGVGSQMGGTSTTTAPAPSIFGQFAGLGTAAAGAYLGAKSGSWRGGGVGNYDAGGSVGSDPYGGVGWIPNMKITGGSGAPRPPAAHQEQQQKVDPSKLAFPRSGVGNTGGPGLGDSGTPEDEFIGGMSPGESGGAADEFAGGMSAPEGGSFMSSFMPEGVGAGLEGVGSAAMEGLGSIGAGIMSALPEGVAAALPFLLLNRGGGVRGYADGGTPGVDEDNAPPVAGVAPPPSYEGGIFGGLGFKPMDWPEAALGYAGRENTSLPMPRQEQQGVAPVAKRAPAYDDFASGDETPASGVGAPPASRSGGFDWSSLSAPLMAAGFGMMASRSPHPLVAIGEGGLAGVGAYAEQKRQTAEHGLAEKKQALDARRLDQMAEQSRQQIALRTREVKLHEGNATATADYRTQRLQNERDRLNRPGLHPLPGATTEDGSPVMFEPNSGNYFAAGSNEPLKPGTKIVNQKADRAAEGSLSDEAVELIAEQRNRGDLSGEGNIGRGAQGPNNLARVRNLQAKKLKDQGMDAKQAAEYLQMVSQRSKAQQMEMNAEARTAGSRLANLNIVIHATEAAIPAALEASEKVWRSGWVPVNKLIQKGEVIASNPDLRIFGMANLQLAEHWARAMNPTGVMRETDRDMALNYLSTADSADTYKKVVAQLDKQIRNEKVGVQKFGEKFGLNHEAKPGVDRPEPAAPADPLASARAAITKGANRDAVIKRLRENGVDPAGL